MLTLPEEDASLLLDGAGKLEDAPAVRADVLVGLRGLGGRSFVGHALMLLVVVLDLVVEDGNGGGAVAVMTRVMGYRW